MIVRKFKTRKFKLIKEQLLKNPNCSEQDDHYNIAVNVNGIVYLLNIQFADQNKILVWDIISISQKDDKNGEYSIITSDKVLSALLNILLWQNVKDLTAASRQEPCVTSSPA